jgi:CBS domain-containing protein
MSAIPSTHLNGSYLMPSLEHATVADAMHPGVVSCQRDTSLTDVARLMAAHHVHCIAVMDVSDQDPPEQFVWGIVTDFDLLEAGLREGEEPTAEAAAHQPTVHVESTMALRDVAQRMLHSGMAHVIVVEPRSRRPAGVLSTLDIAGILAWGEA